nr:MULTISPECIES: VCBS repeat-containing protein [unclassified Allomuricauda]|tara:strand:- start:2602 stop:5901 length:3300 start_codon:yes stop_codon:yes gene_type:complete
MRGLLCIIFGFVLTLTSCGKNENNTLFVKKDSVHTGVTFNNHLVQSPELNILNYLYFYNGAGVAAGDFNNDGLIDLYFTSNQGQDKFYLNQGNFTFKDVTKTSNLNNGTGWTTGVTHADVNNDGLLDIYVCKVGDHGPIRGQNLLYINQGNNDQGIPIFEEQAAKYGLDFIGYSTQAAFFDYDLDGDLDMYLLNHSVNPNRSYGKGTKRKNVDSMSGDILFRNENGRYIDVSKEAGIFQGTIGYGLGLAISDINNDGYPDIYVGNDFFENDYLYINQKDGTFKETISIDDKKLGHTTHFSMGNDIADINNDGLSDILSLDMLPEDLETYKTSGLEYPYPVYQQYLKNGFAPQYMSNALHLNLDGENFAEIANLSGIDATEWSWGALLADFDNDGFKDLFISNGIQGVTNDMDYINYISNEEIQQNIEKGLSDKDMELIDRLPKKKVQNYFYKNNGGTNFTNVTNAWAPQIDSYSNGCVYTDLDNDGDLDLVVNNVNQEAFVMENTLEDGNYIKIKFKGSPKNIFGIGAKAIVFTNKGKSVQENMATRGFMSATDNKLNFGVGNDTIIDSIQIIWPAGKFETLYKIKANQELEVNYADASGNYYAETIPKTYPAYELSSRNIGFVHKEYPSLDFDRNPLTPFAYSNEGPSTAVADVNEDGMDDLFICGGKKQASKLYLQDKKGNFNEHQPELFEQDAINEDIDQVFADIDNDGDLDLIVVSGGNEFTNGKPLQPRLYLNTNGIFAKDEAKFSEIEVNASKIDAVDFDNDGDLDLFIASNAVPTKFGEKSQQYLLENDGNGNFKEVTPSFAPELKNIGNIKDFIWKDLDKNGFQDLIVVGHWNPITIFLNNGKQLLPQNDNGLAKTNGWWNCIELADLDNDGDLDILAGNWGLNTKFNASIEKPVTLYINDFDGNGSIETVVTHFHGDRETAFASKDELAKQMPFLNKKFLFYKDFAKASLEELFGKDKLEEATKRKVYLLATSYFENDGNNNFTPKELPRLVQSSSVNDIYLVKNNKEKINEILMVGNNFEISTQLGRLDASHGFLLQNDEKGNIRWKQNLGISGAARKIEKINSNGNMELIITMNNDAPVFLIKKQNDR